MSNPNENIQNSSETPVNEVSQPVEQVVTVSPEQTPVTEAPAEPKVEASVVVETKPQVQPQPKASNDPYAEVKALCESRKIVQALVVEEVPTGDGKNLAGVRLELIGLPKTKGKPFVPKGQFGFPQQAVKKGATIHVIVTKVEVDQASKRTDIIASRREAHAAVVAGLKPNETMLTGRVAGINPKGNFFVELPGGFEAMLPKSELLDGTVLAVNDNIEVLVLKADPKEMSVMLSAKWAAMVKLQGQVVEVEVTEVAVNKKKNNSECGRHCVLAGGMKAYMPGHTDNLPEVGTTGVKVKVEKVDPKERRLVVLLDEPVDEPTGDQPAPKPVSKPATGSQTDVQGGGTGGYSNNDRSSGKGGYGKGRYRGDREDGDRRLKHRSEKGRRNDRDGGSRHGSHGSYSSRDSEQANDNWGQRQGLYGGKAVDGKIVGFEGKGFKVQIAKGIEGYLDRSEVSDSELSEDALKMLVGGTEKLVVLTVDDERRMVTVSLKRVYPVSVGFRKPMPAVCKEVRPNGDRVVTVGGQLPYTLDGKLPMHWNTHKEVGAVQVGDETTVVLDCVPNARELVFKLHKED